MVVRKENARHWGAGVCLWWRNYLGPAVGNTPFEENAQWRQVGCGETELEERSVASTSPVWSSPVVCGAFVPQADSDELDVIGISL